MQIEVVIEIPKGSRNKYEADDDGVIWLDRLRFTATRYPADYGFVTETLGADGDPLDALVLLDEPTTNSLGPARCPAWCDAGVTRPLQNSASYGRTDHAH